MSAVATAAPAGLVPSTPQELHFAPGLEIRSHLLVRPDGNLLIYGSGGVDADAERFAALGGVSRHYLGHHHEALFPSRWPGLPVLVHEGDRGPVEPALRVRATFRRRHMLGDDFEAIPIPGHTPGSTAYLWDSGEHRMLFTADSVYLRDGEWVAAVLASSDRAAYVESLALLRDLEFDVLVPWAATGGEPPFAFTDDADRRRRLEAILDRVWKGLDH